MRPVSKGDDGGRTYTEYQDALDDLADRIGFYCSYCEIPIQNAPEVEHVQPKSLAPELELSWSNFLLACKTCNTIKRNKPVDKNLTAFPDSDNTYRGLTYKSNCVKVSPDLHEEERALMESVVDLVKLHRRPNAAHSDDRPTGRDRRYRFRVETWLLATKMLAIYRQRPFDKITLDLITHKLAPEKGFFSIWMTVFKDHPEVLRQLIAAFPGTASDCFDSDGMAVRRPSGRI